MNFSKIPNPKMSNLFFSQNFFCTIFFSGEKYVSRLYDKSGPKTICANGTLSQHNPSKSAFGQFYTMRSSYIPFFAENCTYPSRKSLKTAHTKNCTYPLFSQKTAHTPTRCMCVYMCTYKYTLYMIDLSEVEPGMRHF